MSESNNTKQEYIQKFAEQYCDGNIKEAEGMAIAKEVLRELPDNEETQSAKKTN